MKAGNPVDAPTTVSMLIHIYKEQSLHIGSSATLVQLAYIKWILIYYYPIENITIIKQILGKYT